MKYVAVIIAGASDEPLKALRGRTPLEAAQLPNLTRLASAGRVGCAFTTPEGAQPSPEAATLSVLGYDPQGYSIGRAALEAAALGIELNPGDWVLRLSLVTLGDSDEDAGLITDPTAGGITEREAGALLTDLLSHWQATMPELAQGLSLVSNPGNRHLLIDRSGNSYRSTMTSPPSVALREPCKDHLPDGGSEAARLRKLIESSAAFLPQHEVNLARVEQGLRPANLAWPWGQGAPLTVPDFRSRYKARGLMFAGDDAIGGLAVAAGLDRLPMSCGLDDDPLGLGILAESVSDALRSCDLVCCYIDDAARASLEGDWQRKVSILEAIDQQFLGPLLSDLDEQYADPALDPGSEGWRILVISDCGISTQQRQVLDDPVPFVMGGAWVRSAVQRTFTEDQAEGSDLRIDPAHDLMEYFLRGGLASVRAR